MLETREGQTDITTMRLKHHEPEDTGIVWQEVKQKRHGEALLKNLSIASALILCAVALRAGAVPGLEAPVDAVLTAVSGDTLLDDQLGKLSFVSSIFPEAVLVFGEGDAGELCQPVIGGTVVHAWSAQEPYLAWETDEPMVYSAVDGEVIGVYHGENEERLVQVMRQDGLACLYGALESVSVEVGDQVNRGDLLGSVGEGGLCAFEIRRDGFSVDPAGLLP